MYDCLSPKFMFFWIPTETEMEWTQYTEEPIVEGGVILHLFTAIAELDRLLNVQVYVWLARA